MGSIDKNKFKFVTDKEKEQYEETFDDNKGQEISNLAVNQWLFNANTIDQVVLDQRFSKKMFLFYFFSFLCIIFCF